MIVVTVDPLAEIFLEDVGDKRHSSGMVVWQQPLHLLHSVTGGSRPSRPESLAR